jgi:anti-sigma B factor antagonist
MLKTETINNIIVVSFQDVIRFNAIISDTLKAEVKSLFSAPSTKLVLDLTGINFIDSTGFGVLLSIMKTANNNSGFFKICNISEDVMELFKLLQLHNVFEIYKNLDDALRSFD